MADRVAAITAAAIKLIDLEQHSAQHPRLGVVDHISCHPLLTDNINSNTMASAVTAAETIAKKLGSDSVHLPVYLYGHAHPQQRQLVDIRKSFGYFRPNTPTDVIWKGAIQTPPPKYKGVQVPDYGPQPSSTSSSSKTGIVCVGAIPWLINFNVLLNSSDAGVCKEIARAVSEKGGGLKAVQAMALKHDGGRYEVACNLLDESVSGVELVEKEIDRLAGERGVGVVRCYRIGKTPEELLEILLGDGREG
jgi:glutamate formiminotransferase